MKKYIAMWLALCLLLTGCGGAAGTSDPTTTATTTTTGTTVPDVTGLYYADYSVRSMRLRVTSGTDELDRMWDLNNLYQQQAFSVYQTLNVAKFQESYLDAPTGTPWVELQFRPHSDLNVEGETYTLYENDLVVVKHPAVGEKTYTAAAGTYYQTVTRLNALRQEQTRYVTLKSYDTTDAAAGYTIHYANGKSKFHATGTDLPRVDMVGDGIVRVEFRQTFTFYNVKTERSGSFTGIFTDVMGDAVVVADRDGIELYSQFWRKTSSRAYAERDSIRGLSFTEDGTGLHVICTRGDTDAVWDRTLSVAEMQGSLCWYLGAWQSAPDATEKEQQSIGYSLLKKVRHKEKELGHSLSALPKKWLEIDGKVYFLTELGYWDKVDGKNVYTVVAHLMVNEAVTVAYEATPTDNELIWDTAKNWMKQ